MPYSRKNAPLAVPDCETIEYLLGAPNPKSKATRAVKPLDEASGAQQKRKNLVRLGKRCTQIPGDPFGLWPSWAGNVGHPEDERMFNIMRPIFAELMSATVAVSPEVKSLQSLLEMIPTTPFAQAAAAVSDVKEFTVVRDTNRELVITFILGSISVRLMQCHDLDVANDKSYSESSRAKNSQERTKSQLPDPPITPELTQYVMAKILSSPSKHPGIGDFGNSSSGSGSTSSSRKSNAGPFYTLRMTALEEYWLHMSVDQREVLRQEHSAHTIEKHPELQYLLETVKENWHPAWNSPKWHPDFFHRYSLDSLAAEHVWEHVQEDLLVVVDKNRRVVFANAEKLSTLLFGASTTETMARCLDMWSFFTPLPSPESGRHAVDAYIRKIHPELDPSQATVATLPNAKMCVAHYGCWAATGDRNGCHITLTSDSTFTRGGSSTFPRLLFGEFCRAALAKATTLIRFLLKSLDPKYYEECVEIVSNIGEEKITTGPEDFLSLFALGVNGYTQRHKDINDIAGGLAGLCTFGDYEGGNLCIPQLNLKVPYQPGTCALIRGTVIDHLVEDYKGPRFFLIGTNHESVKRNVWRKLGKLPPLPNGQTNGGIADLDHEDVTKTTCINERDDDFDNIQYTNTELHEAGALFPSSPSSEAASP